MRRYNPSKRCATLSTNELSAASKYTEFEFGMTPIPVSEENSVGFFLHLNILGEQKVMNGPVEIGESISIQCLEPGKTQHCRILSKTNCKCFCFYK